MRYQQKPLRTSFRAREKESLVGDVSFRVFRTTAFAYIFLTILDNVVYVPRIWPRIFSFCSLIYLLNTLFLAPVFILVRCWTLGCKGQVHRSNDHHPSASSTTIHWVLSTEQCWMEATSATQTGITDALASWWHCRLFRAKSVGVEPDFSTVLQNQSWCSTDYI